ncbi:hypothetical protein KC723_03010 [Candidatus Kaiserbacteria bacterium]|nr:hypothetical protein [Candidatus Kaiserbacteria bacterium]
MKAKTESVLPAPLDVVWELMQRSDTLSFITKDKVKFLDADNWPEKWQVGQSVNTLVKPTNGKAFPYKFTFTEIDQQNHSMTTTEEGGDVKEWLHWMKVEAVDKITCRYIDVVQFKTNNPLLTIPAWIWIKKYYRDRHYRWIDLLYKKD